MNSSDLTNNTSTATAATGVVCRIWKEEYHLEKCLHFGSHNPQHSDLSSDHLHESSGDSSCKNKAQTSDHVQLAVVCPGGD